MSYCRKEGKDTIIFATEDDLASPSSVTLLPDDPTDLDTSHQSAILPNGDINWDCPCLGNLPNGPCGPMFRDSFTCWVDNKNDQDSFVSNCFENFTKWEECLSENRDIYKSSKKDDDESEDLETENPALTSVEDEIDMNNANLNDSYGQNNNARSSSVDNNRTAIAAASMGDAKEESEK